MPRVALIGTGGSISVLGRNALDLFEFPDFGEVLQADELIARVPEIATVADVVPVRFRTLLSTDINPKDWLELNRRIYGVVQMEAPLDGIAITHGTATLEETAYFLHLTLKVDLPVVVVGAQRPPTGLSSDAPLNLLNAVRVASASASRGLGVIVMLNDEIQSAREATKTSTYRLQAFRSPEIGILGYADPDGKVVIYRTPTRRHPPSSAFDIAGLVDLPRVDITYSYAGADETAISQFVEHGARAIVVAGFAPGTVTPTQWRALVDARRRGVVVVQSSRAGGGRVIRTTRQRQEGIVVADNLTPQKARVLVMLALTRTDDPEQIQTFFDEY